MNNSWTMIVRTRTMMEYSVEYTQENV